MFGLCFGIAVKVHNKSFTTLQFIQVRNNIKFYSRPVIYTRFQAFKPVNQYGISAQYYRALDRCPLRMS